MELKRQDRPKIVNNYFPYPKFVPKTYLSLIYIKKFVHNSIDKLIVIFIYLHKVKFFAN